VSKTTTQLQIVNNLPVFRAMKRLTQEELAKEVNVTRATIIAIEKGAYNPSLELAFRIARYFKTDINEIFKIKEIRK
jgi:putative transcriptional regulator